MSHRKFEEIYRRHYVAKYRQAKTMPYDTDERLKQLVDLLVLWFIDSHFKVAEADKTTKKRPVPVVGAGRWAMRDRL